MIYSTWKLVTKGSVLPGKHRHGYADKYNLSVFFMIIGKKNKYKQLNSILIRYWLDID